MLVPLGEHLDSMQNNIIDMHCYLLCVNLSTLVVSYIIQEQWMYILSGIMWIPFIYVYTMRCVCKACCGLPRPTAGWILDIPIQTEQPRAVAPVVSSSEEDPRA